MPLAHDLHRPWGRLRVWEWPAAGPAGPGSGADATPGQDPPTVIAVHGLGGSGRYWDGLNRALGPGVRIVAHDLAGFGSSQTPAEHALRDLHVADLEAVADRFSPGRPVVVVGYSLGGAIAALWGARRAERVAAMALVCTPFPGDEDLDYRQMHADAPVWRRIGARLARPVWPALALPVAVVKRYPYTVVRDFGRQSFRARVWTMWSVLSDPGAEAELRPLSDGDIPTLLLDAIDDTLVPAEDRRRWSQLLPHAQQRILGDGGHHLLLRTRFAPLARWIEKVSAA